MELSFINLRKPDKESVPPFEFINSAPLLCDHNIFFIDYNVLTAQVPSVSSAVVLRGQDIKMYKQIKLAGSEFRSRGIPVVVVGGIGNASDTLLEKNVADYVITGDPEVVLPKLFSQSCFDLHDVDLRRIAGQKVAYLDDLPFPDYSKIDTSHYTRSKNGKKSMEIFASRGCDNTCSFCANLGSGLRRHSVDYVIDHIRMLQTDYGVNHIDFGDSCFTSSRVWMERFLTRIRRMNTSFRVYGARVDDVDFKLLDALKEAGCDSIYFGFESGSQNVLDSLDKRTSVQDNIRILKYARNIGLNAPVQLLVGSPRETNTTINETITALNSAGLSVHPEKVRCILPQPGTPIYDYYKRKGLILDDESYLLNLDGLDTTNQWTESARDFRRKILQGVRND